MDETLREIEVRVAAGEDGARAELLRARLRAKVGLVLAWAGQQTRPSPESTRLELTTGRGMTNYGPVWCDAVLGLDDLFAVVDAGQKMSGVVYLVDLATGVSRSVRTDVVLAELSEVSSRAHDFIGPDDCGHLLGEHCQFCDGGLQLCKVCRLGEGELTSECPGEDATSHGDAVYAGREDFVGGRWVETPRRPGCAS